MGFLLLQLLVDSDGSFLEIHTVPGQAQHLALTHPRIQRQLVQPFMGLSRDFPQKTLDILVIQMGELRGRNFLQLAVVGGILSKVDEGYSIGQRLVKDAENAFDHFRREIPLIKAVEPLLDFCL